MHQWHLRPKQKSSRDDHDNLGLEMEPGQIFSTAFVKHNTSRLHRSAELSCIHKNYPAAFFTTKTFKQSHRPTCAQIPTRSLVLSSALMCWGLMGVLVIQVNAFACGAYFHSGSHCAHILFRTAAPLLFTHADVLSATTATQPWIKLQRVMCQIVVGALLRAL